MSEGNPRLLAGLLNDLLDAGLPSIHRDGLQTIPSNVQAPRADERLQSCPRRNQTYPVRVRDGSPTLATLVERLGQFFALGVVQMLFQADPLGSFSWTTKCLQRWWRRSNWDSLIGAFVPVGQTMSVFCGG